MSNEQKLLWEILFGIVYTTIGWSLCYFGLYKPMMQLKNRYIEELRSKK